MVSSTTLKAPRKTTLCATPKLGIIKLSLDTMDEIERRLFYIHQELPVNMWLHGGNCVVR